MARNWRESDHPRHPKGRSDGGRFRDDGKPNLPDPDFVQDIKAGKPNPRYAAKKAAPKKAPAKKAAPKKAAPRKAPAKKAPSTKTPARAQTPTTKVASAFHEDWRKTRRQADGSYEPRIKTTKDKAWIRKHGTDQVDIANTSYADLPNDWKKENREAAKVVTDILARNQGAVNLGDKSIREFVGEHIHQEWLKRNAWARGGELDVPFAQLPQSEQDKDIDQLRVAMSILSGPDMDKLRGAKAAPTTSPDTQAARGRLREDTEPWLQRLSDSAGQGRQRIEIKMNGEQRIDYRRGQLNELYDELGIEERESIEEFLNTLVPEDLPTARMSDEDLDYALAQHLTKLTTQEERIEFLARLNNARRSFPETIELLENDIDVIGESMAADDMQIDPSTIAPPGTPMKVGIMEAMNLVKQNPGAFEVYDPMSGEWGILEDFDQGDGDWEVWGNDGGIHFAVEDGGRISIRRRPDWASRISDGIGI